MSKADLEERIKTLKELNEAKDVKLARIIAERDNATKALASTKEHVDTKLDSLDTCYWQIKTAIDQIFDLIDGKKEAERLSVPPSVSAYEFACDLTEYCKGLGDADGNYFLRRIDMLAREVWRSEHPLSDGPSLIYTNPDEATI